MHYIAEGPGSGRCAVAGQTFTATAANVIKAYANCGGWGGGVDPTWREPREDWKCEVIFQRVAVEPGRDYLLTAWLLTGDRGSGWGRDSRVRLAVDESGGKLLEQLDTVGQANATQWFATRHQWQPVTLRFRAKADRVAIGAEFLQWWALEASHLHLDEFTLRPVD